MTTTTAVDREDDWTFENQEDNPTYGSRGVLHVSSRQLTAGQVRLPEPLVDGYIGLQGAEEKGYIFEVSVFAPLRAEGVLTKA